MLAIKKRLLALINTREAFELTKAFETLFNTQCLGSAALAINAATAATWKMSNATPLPYSITGQLYLKTAAAAQAIPAAAALTATANQAVMVTLALDAAGNITTYTSGVSVSTVSSAVAVANLIPAFVPDNLCVIGVLVIASVATVFTPGTTALDAVGITVTYINTTGPFFPIAPV